MSSWIELQEWHAMHGVDAFPWQEWIGELQRVLPLPVYDITRVLDPSQVHDMAQHAAHWSPDMHVQRVHVPPCLARHIAALDLQYSSQVVYMARALYSHCSRYVTGVPLVCCPPTTHLDHVEAVPQQHVRELAHATLTPLPAEGLHAWLSCAVMHGSRRVHRLSNRHRSRKSSGRKGRKHSASAEAREIADKVLAATNQAFDDIVALSPRCAPRFCCHVVGVGSGRISLVLSAVPHAPCDE
jgi:hypothetical protein